MFNNLVKAYSIINRVTYNKIMVSISGGADSDIVLDICYKCDRDNKCEYIWFDTGLEYDATKRHLSYLEEKYGIKIKREERNLYQLVAKSMVFLSCRKTYHRSFMVYRMQGLNSRTRHMKS